ncbi:MAG: alpha/beta hydrolase [Propionibacteriales bacterium]|nr:alpha/beta hydrolase [Propionibacteriales bacterium]
MGADLRAVFVHGAGRVGSDAWPEQAGLRGAEFPVLPGYGEEEPRVGDLARGAVMIAETARQADVLIGWSLGGLVATLAASIHPIRALVVLEPALFSLTRGRPATEALIERVQPVFDDLSIPDVDFGARFLLALTGRQTAPARSPTELRDSRRLRLHGAPWAHPVDREAVRSTPTLVLTGGWNDEYEEVAAALVELGATHEVLAGHGHRVAQHPNATKRILNFSRSVG